MGWLNFRQLPWVGMIELSQSTSRRGSLPCVGKPSDYCFDSKVNAWGHPLVAIIIKVSKELKKYSLRQKKWALLILTLIMPPWLTSVTRPTSKPEGCLTLVFEKMYSGYQSMKKIGISILTLNPPLGVIVWLISQKEFAVHIISSPFGTLWERYASDT